MKRYILDACALIAYLNDEEGATVVEDLFSSNKEIFMSVVNLYEVCYDAARTSDNEHAVVEILETVRQLPIVVLWEVNYELLQAAAKFKVRYRISLADSFALGLADVLDAVVVSADHHELEPVEQAGEVSVLWFR
jgi:PIN domain nuclease of toxin-antitoxin system